MVRKVTCAIRFVHFVSFLLLAVNGELTDKQIDACLRIIIVYLLHVQRNIFYLLKMLTSLHTYSDHCIKAEIVPVLCIDYTSSLECIKRAEWYMKARTCLCDAVQWCDLGNHQKPYKSLKYLWYSECTMSCIDLERESTTSLSIWCMQTQYYTTYSRRIRRRKCARVHPVSRENDVIIVWSHVSRYCCRRSSKEDRQWEPGCEYF